MKKLTDSKGLGTCLRFAFLVSAFGIANFVRAEYVVERQSPPSGPEGVSESLAYDLNATSQNNALATPDGGRGDVIPGRTSLPPASDALPRSDINKLIVQMINKMPQGGEYHASSESTQKLASAIRVQGDNLDIHPDVAMPSFCSSATYLLFVSVLDNLNKNKQLAFEQGVAEKLRVNGQKDGVGVWGRWNANGPGTARLFEELSLGTNFTSIDRAEPGDFLKIFWNDQIGLKEFGHSVVYLGHGVNSEGVDTLKYWSSNKKDGYGRAEVPTSKIKRTLFSHLSNPEQINRVFRIPATESYLASMLISSSTPEKMYEMVGITAWTAGHSIPASNIGTKVKAKEKNSKTGAKSPE